jgi:hypothetical protein
MTSGTGLTLMPNTDVGLTKLSAGRNADAELFPVFRHLQKIYQYHKAC